MNKIQKQGDKYTLICDDGKSLECTRFYEKKTDVWHVKLPKDNPSGRQFVRESNFDKTDIYEFPTKTEHRTGLTGGGWRSKLTEDEKTEVEKIEKRLEEIKTEASKRETPKKLKAKSPDEMNEEELEREIAKLLAEQAARKVKAEPKPKTTKK